MIAKIARADRGLFHPVGLRDGERHEMVQITGLREVAVTQRTRAVNSVRSLCKANGETTLDERTPPLCADTQKRVSPTLPYRPHASNTDRNVLR